MKTFKVKGTPSFICSMRFDTLKGVITKTQYNQLKEGKSVIISGEIPEALKPHIAEPVLIKNNNRGEVT